MSVGTRLAHAIGFWKFWNRMARPRPTPTWPLPWRMDHPPLDGSTRTYHMVGPYQYSTDLHLRPGDLTTRCPHCAHVSRTPPVARATLVRCPAGLEADANGHPARDGALCGRWYVIRQAGQAPYRPRPDEGPPRSADAALGPLAPRRAADPQARPAIAS